MLGKLKWGRILNEYKHGKNSIEEHIIKCENDEKKEVELEISKGMYSEISTNILSVKKHYLSELKSFLESDASSVFTEKQHRIMSLRAEGYSMDKIGEILNISKTAVYKSVKLSEKKIYIYYQ